VQPLDSFPEFTSPSNSESNFHLLLSFSNTWNSDTFLMMFPIFYPNVGLHSGHVTQTYT
jgi:hypothetical protein